MDTVNRLMLRQSGSLYVGKRSMTLLKVKTFFDAEAKVIGYEPGKVGRPFQKISSNILEVTHEILHGTG